MNHQLLGPTTRRGFLGISIAAGTIFLAGCATGTPDAPGGPSAGPVGEPKRGGVMRLAATTGGGADMDPHGTTSNNNMKLCMFDGLVESDADVKTVNALAEVFEPDADDVSKWTITVKEGVKWHDGRTLSSQDVEFTIRRILDPKNPKAQAALLSDIDPDGITIVDDRTLRLDLKAPNSQLRESFGPTFAAIVPVGFDPAKPIGTGPFKHVSFVPEQRWTGARHDDYWRIEGGPYLEKFEIIAFESPSTALSAMLAGQVDAIGSVMPNQLPQLANRKDLTTIESETGLILFIGMDTRPGAKFEDKRVREAFRLALDRPQLVDTVYSGHGKIGTDDIGVFEQWDAGTIEPGLAPRTRDIARAKQLLEDAGKAGMSVKLRVGNRVPGMVETGQIVQQQLKEIGVAVEIDMVADATAYYSDAYFEAELQIDFTQTATMFSNLYYYLLSKSGYNSTGYSNAEIDRLFDEGVAKPDAGYRENMRKVSRILYDEGPWIVWGRQNVIDAYSTKFVGVGEDAGGNGFNGQRFWAISQA